MRYGRNEVVENLLYFDLPDLDEPDHNGCSLLMYASLHGFLGAVEYLLDNGANVNRLGNCPEITATRARHQSALCMAVYNGHSRVVSRLFTLLRSRHWRNIGIFRQS
jgi:ankyrin repeat protein